MWQTEIIETEDGLGIVLPDAVMQRLNLSVGDEIVLIENENNLTIKPLEIKKF